MSILDEFFDKIFVLNLDSRTDRWESILANFKKFNIKNFERFSAIQPDLNSIPPAWYGQMNFKLGKDKHAYLRGASGCKMSHVEILKIAKKEGYTKVLIIEDDAQLEDNIEEIFKAGNSQIGEDAWDMLYLSGNHIRRTLPHTQNSKKLTGTFATHGYGIKANLFDNVINNALNYGREIDVFYANQIHPKNKCYCLEPHVIRQGAGYSDIVSKEVRYGC